MNPSNTMTTAFLRRAQAAQGDWLDALALVREVLGEQHHERWLFRVHYEPLRTMRVLADLRCAIREGKPIRDKEAYANFLWNDWK